MMGTEEIAYPDSDPFTFHLKEEHIKLLRHMNTQAWYGSIWVMKPKRPYGDMTNYFLDVADALGDTYPVDAKGYTIIPPDVETRYQLLHGEMLFAVQSCWEHGIYP